MVKPAGDVECDVEDQTDRNDHPNDEPQHLLQLSDSLPLLPIQRLPEFPDFLNVEIVDVETSNGLVGEKGLGPGLWQQDYPENKTISRDNSEERGIVPE